jgi:hypothetical protein
MNGKNFGDGFHFNYDQLSHYEVQTVPAVQRHAMVAKRKSDLPLMYYPRRVSSLQRHAS